jgi:predicted MFS family arabinose efflux permease
MQRSVIVGPTAGQLARLLVALVTMSCLSQFYRVSNSVIAPELMRELGMSSQHLGIAGGAFFFTLLIAQVPVGIWFDRYGARITLTLLSVFAVIGAVMVSRAATANDLIIARTVTGLGCAANFMALVFVLSRWVEPARYTTVLSWGFALSNLGSIAAATPLAWAAATIGWRHTFVGLAVVSAVGAAVFYAVVRDDPPGAASRPEAVAGGFREEFAGLLSVWRTPGLVPILAMHTFAYATQLTVMGIWAGPYLFDVYGLDGLARGNILLLMGLAQIAGVFSYGPLDRLVGSRKKVVITGAATTIATLIVLASLTAPPLWLAVVLLNLVTYLASYGVVIVSQGRALFPPALAGRGATTVNMAQLLGLMGLPIVTGAIVNAFPSVGGVAPTVAYQAAFAALAVGNMCGLVVYLRSTDSRP